MVLSRNHVSFALESANLVLLFDDLKGCDVDIGSCIQYHGLLAHAFVVLWLVFNSCRTGCLLRYFDQFVLALALRFRVGAKSVHYLDYYCFNQINLID